MHTIYIIIILDKCFENVLIYMKSREKGAIYVIKSKNIYVFMII